MSILPLDKQSAFTDAPLFWPTSENSYIFYCFPYAILLGSEIENIFLV